MAKRKADILLLGLLVLVINIIAFLALLHYAPKIFQKPPQQPQQNNIQVQPQPKQTTIVATIETSRGGSVLANGTNTYTWSSSKSFTLLLRATPDTCYEFDHWEVNGEKRSGTDLALTITSNTTIRAMFRQLTSKLSINSNYAGVPLSINGSIVRLPYKTEVQCGATVKLKLLPWSNESLSLTPVRLSVNDTPILGTEAEIRVQGVLYVDVVYQYQAYALYIDTNAPGVKVLVDGQEVTLPTRIQRAKPFTVLIQAPPLVKVNDTFAWGSPEFQARDYIRGVYTWVTFATGQTPIHVEENEKTIRVYYYPLYSLGKDTYVVPTDGKAYMEGNTIVATSNAYFVYAVNIILPPNWTRARVRVESNTALSAVVRFPYNKSGNIYDLVAARVDAQRGPCTKLTAEFEVVRNPPSARVLSYYCDAKIEPNQYYTPSPWNFGKGNEQYLGRLIVVDGTAKDARIYVEVEG